MKKYILLAFLAFTVECSHVSENAIDREEPYDYLEMEPMQPRKSYGRHPYLEGDFYADIAGLDLTAKSYTGPGGRRTKDWPSISVIETNTGSCVKSGGVIGLEFQLSLESLSRDLTHSELVVELENSEDAVSLLSSYVLWGEERNGESKTGQPRVRNSWLIYDVNDILMAFKAADQRSKTVRLSVRLVAAPLNRNAAGSEAVFDACRFYSRRPPTMFLYHDFPKEFRQHLRRASRARRSPVRRSVGAMPNPRSDQGTDCHLHQGWTVDFHQIGMKWIIAPVLFKVNYCHGVCSPSAWNQTDIRGPPSPGKVTNHALLFGRALANLPQSVSMGFPAPSCVPANYDSMNMIYMDRDGLVRVGTFPQTIATSCICA